MKTITRFGLIISLAIILLVACTNNERSDATESPSVIVNDGTSEVASSAPAAAVATAAETATVHITQAGFEPNELTVKAGTTLIWINDDSQSHWVASDPYPIHTNLVGFDASQPLEAGGQYQFTFTKIGDWTYHDHLRPITYTGRVIVTE